MRIRSLLLSGLLIATASSIALPVPAKHLDAPSGVEPGGVLRVLTYNVAGLPEGFSQSRPRHNLPRIGELLNEYDLALIQEDFAYPDLLRENIRLPFASPPFVRGDRLEFGDGLSYFGKLPFDVPKRTKWSACNGVVDSYHDCLTSKGLSATRVTLSEGVHVDVYNVHLDAGNSPGDRAARSAQLQQLIQTIRQASQSRAFILGGDFNLSPSERHLLTVLESTLGAADVCTLLRCHEPWRIDRIVVRSSDTVRLVPKTWSVDRRFRDPRGRPLSDHLAVAVELAWSHASAGHAH